MATVTVEGMGRFDYTITVNNTSEYGTLTFTLNSFENLSPSKYKVKKGYWAGIKVDGKNFVGHTSKLSWNVKYSNQGASGPIASDTSASDRPVMYVNDKQEYRKLRKLYNDTQQRYLKSNLTVLSNNISKKVSNNKNTKTIKVTGNQRDVTIVFQIYGYKQTVSQKVGKSTSPSSPSSSTSQQGVEYASITSVNNGIPYLVKTDAYKEYGWIERVVDFNDIEDPSTLKRVGQIYLDSLQFNEMSIEVTALDLHYIDNTVQKLALLDSVRCISKPHGLNKVFPITKITIPLDHPDQVKYTLGTNQAGGGGISASSSKDAKQFIKSLQAFPTKAYTLDTAKSQMSNLLNQRTTGYVTIVDRSENDQTHSEAIIISSGQDWTTSQSLWKWDYNGLGFSDKRMSEMSQSEINSMEVLKQAGKAWKYDADDRYYKIGITNDGTIVADVIKTGVLSDGTGYNYWDLANGVISLSVRSDLLITYDKDDNTKTTSAKQLIQKADDANEAAASATVAATLASNTANTALNRKIGATNYFTGTGALNTTSSFNDGTNGKKKWYTYGTNSASVAVYSFDGNGPSTGIKKYIRLKNGGGIEQRRIPVLLGVTYTISCYAKTYNSRITPNSNNATLCISYGSDLNAGNVKAKDIQVTTSWKRYSIKFTVSETYSDRRLDEPSGSDEETASGLVGGQSVNVHFYVSQTSSADIQICGLKMENGVSATDWCETQYIDAETIYDKSVEYTNIFAEAEATLVKNYFTQKELVKRIKGNGQGIWTTSTGQLIISGSYIQTGAIASKNTHKVYNAEKHTYDDVPDSSWNLNTGKFITNDAGLKGTLVSKSGIIGKCQTYNLKGSYSNFYQLSQLKNGSFTSIVDRDSKQYSVLSMGSYYSVSYPYKAKDKMYTFPTGYIRAPYGLTISLKPKSKHVVFDGLHIIGSNGKEEPCNTEIFTIKYLSNVYMKNGSLHKEYDVASFAFLDGFYVSPWKTFKYAGGKDKGGTWYG